jgi:electron transfer flavoprotein alpha subunit
MAANCTEVHPEGEQYLVTRLRWGGSLLEEARLSGDPKLLTVAPHIVPATTVPAPIETSEITVETFTPSLDEKAFRVRLTKQVETAGDRISLADARVVIGGGRGVGSAEGFAALEALADLLGGAVGGSRVVTNLGWRPHADQVGQTGTRIAPDLYIACGISGAIQHMVGCAGAKHVLAINTDRQAPIMAKADYAVIGDLHEILPALIEAVKKAKDGL